MKSLRARSTCASRSCIRSNERASRPSSSGCSSPIGWSNRPAAIRLEADSSLPTRRETATASRPADDHRDGEREAGRDQDLALDQRGGGVHVAHALRQQHARRRPPPGTPRRRRRPACGRGAIRPADGRRGTTGLAAREHRAVHHRRRGVSCRRPACRRRPGRSRAAGGAQRARGACARRSRTRLRSPGAPAAGARDRLEPGQPVGDQVLAQAGDDVQEHDPHGAWRPPPLSTATSRSRSERRDGTPMPRSSVAEAVARRRAR